MTADELSYLDLVEVGHLIKARFSGSRIFPASIGTWAKASAGSSIAVWDCGIWSIFACEIIGFIREPDRRRSGIPNLFPPAHAARGEIFRPVPSLPDSCTAQMQLYSTTSSAMVGCQIKNGGSARRRVGWILCS